MSVGPRRASPAISAPGRALPSFTSRRDLNAAARRHAHRSRGRDRFIWESRVVGIGIPLAIATGVAAWNVGHGGRSRSVARFAAFFGLSLGATYLLASAEWRRIEALGED